MRLYCCGPMTNMPDWNYPAFNHAAAQLRAAGYEVVNPAESGDDTSLPWEYHLKRDLKALLDCDGVACLLGWGKSKGARLEYHVAEQLGMPCHYVSVWVGMG